MIGDEIRRCREMCGVSQKRLSGLSGVTQANISLWETGRRSPLVSNLELIADAMGCDLRISFVKKGETA